MEQLEQIAKRIRELREITGISPEKMAEITGVTKEQYLSAESGKNDFSFTFIHSCALAFGVDITDIISGEEARLSSFSIVRSGEGMPLERRHGFKYNHLASAFKGRLSEPFRVVAKYEKSLEEKPISLASHAGEEFDYIIKGVLKVKIGSHTDFLYPGDAIYYNSSEPHGMVAAQGADCEFLAIVTDAAGRALEYNAAAENAADEKKPTRKCNIFDVCETTEDEKGRITGISFHGENNFNFAYDVVDRIAKEEPDRLAMLHVDNDKNEKRFTFSDISRESNRAANYLTSLGITKGDRVMLVLKRHYHFWIAMTALEKIGAVVIPATNLLMKKDFEYRFDKAGVKAILCTPDGEVSDEAEAGADEKIIKIIVKNPKPGWHFFDGEYASFSDEFERPADYSRGEDTMLMFFTSGTTGYPKVAVHSHKYALGHIITAKYWHNVDPDGIHFTISDTGWGKALWGKLYGQWLCRGAIFTYDFERFSAHDILPMFAKYNITTFCAPPTMYRFFIKEDLSKYDLSSIKYATVAGEALNPEVYQQFLKATGVKLMEGFGQTETTLVVGNLVGRSNKIGSMGKPSPLYSVDIVDPDGKSVRDGETGEIVIRTDKERPCGLFKGYFDKNAPDLLDKELTSAAWHDGLYHTGDTAWRDEDGYFWYVGRIDDLIKSSGYRIGPFEIESVIMELPYVLECAITAAPDEIRGQVVKATIVLVKGKEGGDELKKEIQNYVKTHTAPYKYPRIVEFVAELPKTISGKIKRAEIRTSSEK